MKLVTLICVECNKEDEYLLTSEELEASKTKEGLSSEECSSCTKGPLKLPEGRIQLESGHGKHFTWGQWNIS